MATTKDQQTQDEKDFADQFNQPDAAPKTQTEDEAFGLADDQQDASGNAGAAEAGAGGDAGAEGAAAAAPGAAAAGGADDGQTQDKALQERSAALDAREAELTKREAAMQTSNTNEQQTSSDGKAGGDGGADESSESQDDPAKALAEDFGPEFVDLITRLIKQTVSGSVKDSLNPLQTQIQGVIDDLQNDRRDNHFKAIKAAHADFMDIVESPEFTSWVQGLPDTEKSDAERVIQSGSAEQIVAMLTKFKKSKDATSGAGDGAAGIDDDQLDAAEGVRSTGLRLPNTPNDSEDYAQAWNAA